MILLRAAFPNRERGSDVKGFLVILMLLPVALRADFDVYFLRHGETTWNREKRLQGSIAHIPLTDAGRKMAIMTGVGMRSTGLAFDRIYSSPLLRARETAALIVKQGGQDIHVDCRLREMCFGQYEGCLYAKGMFADDNMRRLFEAPELYVPKGTGAERFRDVRIRVREFLDKELRPLDGHVTNVLCVTHSLLLKSLVQELAGASASHEATNPLQRNCCVHHMKYSQGRFSLVDTSKVYYDAAVDGE